MRPPGIEYTDSGLASEAYTVGDGYAVAVREDGFPAVALVAHDAHGALC